MQGRWNEKVDKKSALDLLGEALCELGDHATSYGVPLIYEPLNRYETNLCNRLQDGVDLINASGAGNAKLLADLFHMNIEETNVADALVRAGDHVGHVHFVDSNRQAAGAGHTDFKPIADALKQINYQGFVSAEAFALPDSQTAAKLTIESYKRLFG